MVRITQSILGPLGPELMIGNSQVKTTRLAALAGIAATAVAASFLAPTATPADAAPSAGNPRSEAQQAAAPG